VCEGVSHQEIAEFVVNAGRRNGETRKKREPQAYDQQKEQETSEEAASRERLDAFPNCIRSSLA
jgi:hypothetical protein